MKKWLLIPVMNLALSLQSFAQTPSPFESESILLNYEQFSHLTHSEQKTYVKKLRETMLEVARAYPEVAAELSARSTFYAQLWALNLATAFGEAAYSPETISTFIRYANDQAARYASSIEKAKTSNLSDKEKTKLVEEYRQALYWSAAAASQAHNISNASVREKILRESVTPAQKQVENLESKVKQFASEDDYKNARDNFFKKAHQGELLPGAPLPNGALVTYGERLTASTQNPRKEVVEKPKVEKKPEVKPEEKKAEVKPEEKKQEKKVAEKAPEKKAEVIEPVVKAAPAEKATTSNDAFYRCMYAGFVIKNHPCSAPSKLPWELQGINDEEFVCSNGTIMCNPFLFGFKAACDWSKADDKGKKECVEKAQPHCVRPGLYATRNCGEVSNNDDSLEAAVHLIHKNPAAFNQYGKSFDDLCNKHLINFNSYAGHSKNAARTKNDITRTCDSARKRMDEIKKRYMIYKESQKPKTAPPAAPTKSNEGKK